MSQWEDLRERLRRLAEEGPLLVAFSGGLDSRFLVHAALAAGVDVLAVHATGPHLPAEESRQARRWAARRGVPLEEVRAHVLDLPGVANNSRERCYHCKTHLLTLMRQHAPHRIVCDGTNADDLGVYRPGLHALREAGVRSPLAEAGLHKARLRELAAATGLEDPQQAARPCLLTRLAYGMRPQASLLERVAAAEAALADLGLRDFRLRLTPAPVLQSLPLPEAMRAAALRLVAEYGFPDATLLEESRLSGYFDRDTPHTSR